MPFLWKLAIANLLILSSTFMGRKFPSLAGLVATMPLTGAIVLLWLGLDAREDTSIIKDYSLGALLGVAPSAIFFATVYLGLSHGLGLGWSVVLGFAGWLLGAFLHQLWLA